VFVTLSIRRTVLNIRVIDLTQEITNGMETALVRAAIL